MQIVESIQKTNPEQVVIPMSIYSRQGLDDVRKAILELVESLEQKGHVGITTKKVKAESKNEISEFMRTRSVCDVEPIQYPGSEG